MFDFGVRKGDNLKTKTKTKKEPLVCGVISKMCSKDNPLRHTQRRNMYINSLQIKTILIYNVL